MAYILPGPIAKEAPMKLSARNILKGKIKQVTH